MSRAFLTRIGMYPDYAEGDRRDRRSSQWSMVMLNYEYARLVEKDRRREIAERIRIERALHPDDGLVDPRSHTTPATRSLFTPERSAPSTAR